MPRSRNIKPALFKNELLGEGDPLLTILFAGLWCLADRDGKLEDRPKRIKAEIFAYRELPDFNGYLTELKRLGFIDRYVVDGAAIIKVLEFGKHQSPHKTEKKSELPDKCINSESKAITENAPLNNGRITEEAALIPDSLIPDSLIPDSLNLIPEVNSSQRKKTYPHDFELFWNAYPSNRRGSKQRALVEWKSVEPENYQLIVDHVLKRKESDPDWLKEQGKYICHAERFLKGNRWEETWSEPLQYSEATARTIHNLADLDLDA